MVLQQHIRWEIALTCDTWDSTVEAQLTANLIAFVPSRSHLWVAQVVWSHTNIHAALVSSMLSPPVSKYLIISHFFTNLPIELWYYIVNPSLLHPQENIGIQLVVVLKSVGLATTRVVLLIAPDTKWRDTKLYLWFDTIDGIAHLLNGQVYVVATPITYVVKTTWVFGKCLSIWELLTRNRIRIEIVIHVNGLYIVSSNEVCHHFAEKIACLLQMRGKIPLRTILQEPFRMFVVNVIRSNILYLASTACYTVWVNPYVYIYTTFMCFSANELQWVVGRSLALLASEPSAPRL